MEFIKKNANTIIIVALVVAIIGLFLPFVKATAFGISVTGRYIEGDGVFVLILNAIAIVFIVLDMLKIIKKENLAFIISIIAVGISTLILIIDASSNLSSDYVSLAIGFWLILIGNIAALATIIIKKLSQKSTTNQNV